MGGGGDLYNECRLGLLWFRLRTPISNLKIVRQQRTTGDYVYYASRR